MSWPVFTSKDSSELVKFLIIFMADVAPGEPQVGEGVVLVQSCKIYLERRELTLTHWRKWMQSFQLKFGLLQR